MTREIQKQSPQLKKNIELILPAELFDSLRRRGAGWPRRPISAGCRPERRHRRRRSSATAGRVIVIIEQNRFAGAVGRQIRPWWRRGRQRRRRRRRLHRNESRALDGHDPPARRPGQRIDWHPSQCRSHRCRIVATV